MSDKLQTNFDIIRLYDEKKPAVPVTKVGILPFIVEKERSGGRVTALIKLLAMKPSPKAKHMGDPSLQVAKGTRRVFINEEWHDMRDDDLRYADESFHEPLLATALREGEEEVGLKSSNIVRLFDLGCFTFVSASRGIKKPLHMFAAEIRDPQDFTAFESTTELTRWLTPDEFAEAGRADHVAIVSEIVARIIPALV